jgi:predicted short-subunit dehydrogenase-like oxidoreductase (DUF2520 family)
MKVAVVGAGRAGRALCRALRAKGFAVRLLDRGGIARPRALVGAEVVLFAVPDDRIRAVASSLRGRIDRSAVVLHLAGALGPEALWPLRHGVRGTGVFHPLQSLADPARGARSLGGALFAVAGDEAALGVARRLARALGGTPIRVRPSGRVLYHAAAALTSGGVATILSLAEDAMVRAGLPRGAARRGLLALLAGTAANAAAMGPRAALTGPIARGDGGTIRRHRRALRALGPDAVRLYDALVRVAEP